MKDMILTKRELAQAFQVSVNSIDAWSLRGLPRLAHRTAGRPCQYSWNQCEDWLYMYKTWPNYGDPDHIIGAAYHRALAIVKTRMKAKRKRT